MDNKIIVRYAKEEFLYEEKLEILMEGVCKSIFPVSIIHEKDAILSCIHTSGYKPLSNLVDIPADVILSVIEKIIIAIEECSQFLIFPEEYVLNMRNIYINNNYDDIKMVYIPDKRREKVEFKLRFLLNKLKNTTKADEWSYINNIIEMYSVRGISLAKLKYLTSRVAQEIKKYKDL